MTKLNVQKVKQIFFQTKKFLREPGHLILTATTVFFVIWFVSSLQSININRQLQKKLHAKEKQLELLELTTNNIKLEQAYLKTAEFQDLAIRKSSNFSHSNEKIFIVKLDEKWIEKQHKELNKQQIKNTKQFTNFEKWTKFLFEPK